MSEKGDSFLRPLKKKDFKEESMTKVGLYAIGTSTTLASNKSLLTTAHASSTYRLTRAGMPPLRSGA